MLYYHNISSRYNKVNKHNKIIIANTKQNNCLQHEYLCEETIAFLSHFASLKIKTVILYV